MRNCLKLCCICTIIIIFSGCWQVMDSVFKNPTNYGVKYAHVQNEKVFQQEMNDIIARITSSDFTAVNDLIELRDTTHFQIVNREITIDCRNFSHKTDIDTILSTKRNPCNNQQIGSSVDFAKYPYKEFYGRKFENIERYHPCSSGVMVSLASNRCNRLRSASNGPSPNVSSCIIRHIGILLCCIVP